LLAALFNALPIGMKSILTLDGRMLLPESISPDVQIKRVKPTIVHRLVAERRLVNNVEFGDVVLCFGNLPPLFKSRGHVVVFVQNRYLIESIPLNRFPLRVRLRLAIERLWLSKRLRNADEFVVQTPTMKRLMEIKTRGRVPVSVLPFVADPRGYTRSLSQKKDQKYIDYDFVYVASGEPHKNHRRLIDAWCLLAEEGLFPSLCLTLDEIHFPELCRLIDEIRYQYGVKVTNAGGLPHHDILELYKKSMAAIYPSTFESFGLPLIEARQAGLPVLASELDYVRDVLDPEQTFDPESAASIARAVKRFMGIEDRLLPLQDAAGFIEHLLEGVK
jgi:glycosyltransferase involved in cell wall biosynthesis